ncbi:MAG: cupin domain-containing protein [Selenomonadales bacterium]|jgi:quercetin dioxygenase-like cupin family protein|nr:cupin domain-containing protein [Selenomonadales bacterium]
MPRKILKNIETSKVLSMKDLVSYQDGQIISKTLIQNQNLSITLFAFDKGEEISTHASGGDALVLVLDGVVEVTIADEKHRLSAGEAIVMPAEVPHAVLAAEKMKFMLTVAF